MGFGLYAIAATESPAFFYVGMTGSGPTAALRDPNSLMAWNVTDAVLLNATQNIQYYDVHGWSYVRFAYATMANGSKCLLLETYDRGWLGIGNFNYEDLLWLNYSDPTEDFSYRASVASVDHWVMPLSQLDWLYGWHGVWGPFLTDLDYLHFTMTNGKGSMNLRITFNTTAYMVPSTAVEGEGLYFSINQDFSDRRTSVNLMDFIFGLFAFSAPGVPYPISTILSMVWWGCVAALSYVVLTIIRSFIPFLGGGD